MKYGEFERRVEAIIQEASDDYEIEEASDKADDDGLPASAFVAFKAKVAAEVAWLVHTEVEQLERDQTRIKRVNADPHKNPLTRADIEEILRWAESHPYDAGVSLRLARIVLGVDKLHAD